VLVLLFTLPPGAPLRRPDGQVDGNSPFMDSLLFMITLFFLISGIAYGRTVGTIKGSADVIKAVTKTFAGLAGLVFMLLMISQFIALFNFSNLPRVIAVALADVLQQANIGALHAVDRGGRSGRDEHKRFPGAAQTGAQHAVPAIGPELCGIAIAVDQHDFAVVPRLGTEPSHRDAA